VFCAKNQKILGNVNPELVGYCPEVRLDPQDGLANAEGVAHLPACLRVGVRLIQYGHHDIALLDGIDVLFENMLRMVVGAGDLLGQEYTRFPGATTCRPASGSRSARLG